MAAKAYLKKETKVLVSCHTAIVASIIIAVVVVDTFLSCNSLFSSGEPVI